MSEGILGIGRYSRCHKGETLRGILAVLAVVRIVAVAWDCRCHKGGILRGILAVLAVPKDCRCRQGCCRQGFSLSPWDSRRHKGGILRGILAVLAFVGIVAVVRD